MLLPADLPVDQGTDYNFYHYGTIEIGIRRTGTASSCPSGVCNVTGVDNSIDPKGYTDCLYCHQNTSGNVFASVMNVDAEYHSNMQNHTNRSMGPHCTDCHGYGVFHSERMVIPYKRDKTYIDRGGMFNSSLCKDCHRNESGLNNFDGGNRINKEEHAYNRSARLGRLDNETVKCVTCHANDSNYTAAGTLEKQIHGIRYFNQSGVYSAPWTKAGAANCTTCHQDVNIAMVGNLTLPKIPIDFNHSDDPEMGSIWNTTSVVYWNRSADANSMCYYCHAVSPTGNKTPIIHNATPLGPVQAALGGNNTINGTINDTSEWCGACHYPNNIYYDEVMARFDALGKPRPPSNTNTSLATVNYSRFYDHNTTLNETNAKANDSVCFDCHGGLLYAGKDSGMTTFAHNVKEAYSMLAGNAPGCEICHNSSKNFASKKIDITAFAGNVKTLHGNISGNNETVFRNCILCHFNTSGMGPDFEANYTRKLPNGADNQDWNTYYCADCHLVPTDTSGNKLTRPNITYIGNPPDVYAHTPYNTTLKYTQVLGTSLRDTWLYTQEEKRDIKRGISSESVVTFKRGGYRDGDPDSVTGMIRCEGCHNNSVKAAMVPTSSGVANVSHYGTTQNLTINNNDSRAGCDNCHTEYGASLTERAKWGIGGDSESGLIYNTSAGYKMGWGGNETACYECHIVQNKCPNSNISDSQECSTAPVYKPQENEHFHTQYITRFMWNCYRCH
jgi:hypothetical protein